jgi:hypothetical protein
MIKGISQGGRYIAVTGGSPGSNYVNNYSSAQGVGNMRFNTSNQNMEVWDGNTWMTLQSSYATVQLDEEAIRILDWAKKKMFEEEVLLSLPSDNPAVKIARQNVNRAKQALKEAEDQLKITEILSQNEEHAAS